MRRAQGQERQEQQEEREVERRKNLIQSDDHAQRKQMAHSVFSARVCVCVNAASSKEWEESEWGRVSGGGSALETEKCDDDARAPEGFHRVRVLHRGEWGVEDLE